MGNRHITQKFHRRILRTDRNGLIRFLDRMRDLEEDSRREFVEKGIKFSKDTYERHVQNLESTHEITKRIAIESVDGAKKEYEDKIVRFTNKTQMKATFTLTDSATESFSGTPREIVENNNFTRAQRVSIQPSGSFSGPVDITISRSTGIEVELSTGDEKLIERARLSIPAWLSEISAPGQFMYRPSVLPTFWALIIGINLILLMNPEIAALSVISWASVSLMGLHYFLRFVLYPQVFIREEPRSMHRVLSWVGYAIVTILLGILGTFIYDQIK